jgi:YD repeat-containing protein
MQYPFRTALAALAFSAALGAHASEFPSARDADATTPPEASADAQYLLHWVADRRDAQGRPYAVVDKQGARMFVFDADGHLVGQTPVLTGLARGDDSVPGIGDRPVAQIKPSERTTPAGRFESQPGHNLTGESVVWVDYDTGIAIHRLRPGRSEAGRLRDIASPVAADHRQSYGCVVVPPAFFDAVVDPVLGHSHGVVYVMPDDRPVQAMFGADTPDLANAGHAPARLVATRR